MRPATAALAAVLLALSAVPVRADDVTDQIGEALEAYRKKDVSTAVTALEAALSLLRQSRADSWKSLLPAPPSGWAAEEAETTAGIAAMFGGGTGASRKYTRGDEDVEVSLLGESPMVQGMAAMLSNPMIAAGAGRVVVIGGRRMTYVKDENAYMTMVADKVLVRVKGSRGVTDAMLRTFVTALPFGEIEKAAR